MSENTEKNSKMSSVKWGIIIIVLALISFFSIRAYNKSQHHEKTDNAQLDASIVSIRAAVTGFISEVRVLENQPVKKGDTLALIDNSDYSAKWMQAKAQLQSAEAQTGVSRSAAEAAQQTALASALNITVLKSNIDAAKARFFKAEKDLGRIDKMFAEGASTQQQLDAAKAEQQTAKALLEMAEEQFIAAKQQSSGVSTGAKATAGQIGVSGALVQQRLAELQLAETQLKNTVIVAPFDGIVSKKSIEIGQLVQYGQPVCSLVATNKLWVVANFKETQLNKIRVGQTAKIHVDAYPELKLTGKVQSIGGATGARFSLLPPDNATGNFVKVTQRIPVRIVLDSNTDREHLLAPGLSVFVDVEIK
jgi:membrane fusion protein (multidrug efflux system)